MKKKEEDDEERMMVDNNKNKNKKEKGEEEEEEEEEGIIRFIEYAIRWEGMMMLGLREEEEERDGDGDGDGIGWGWGWGWTAGVILKTCISYSSGVTPAILLSDLSLAWSDQQQRTMMKNKYTTTTITTTPSSSSTNFTINNNSSIIHPSRRQPQNNNNKKKQLLLPKGVATTTTTTIDDIYHKNFLSLNSVLHTHLLHSSTLPGTNIQILSLGDFLSSHSIDLYLHPRYYSLVESGNGILKKGREVLLTGCYLRPASRGSSAATTPRLLPTEYLVILLDEDQDDDAMLLGAQFCEDNFSSISLDAVNQGTTYSLYARIESIGSLEIQGQHGNVQRRQIGLVDNDGVRLQFVLWGDQVVLANLFSVGSMLALDRPFVASLVNTCNETSEPICLEYGSATQLYLVPFLHHEEQVSVAVTQNCCQGSNLTRALDPTQGFKISQVTLPCDSQGSVDYSDYPSRIFITDLHDKMTSITLYGVVADISHSVGTVGNLCSLKIEDATGTIWAKLHLIRSWTLGRLGIGHNVFIRGLTCLSTREGLGVSWFEKDVGNGTSFVNLSCLPALLTSDCLHKLSYLSSLSSQSASKTHICRIRLDQIEHCHVNTRLSHVLCGHFASKAPNGVVKCNFCHCDCNSAEIICTFHLRITVADDTAKVCAWCVGQTATELLQISPEDFSGLPEEEQIMYPSSLENEKFIVALVNSKRRHSFDGVNDILTEEHSGATWEITRALKCE